VRQPDLRALLLGQNGRSLGKDRHVGRSPEISAGVEEHPEVIEALQQVSISSRTIQRDQLPEDVVGAVVYLCGPSASFVTGQTIVIDGGQTFH